MGNCGSGMLSFCSASKAYGSVPVHPGGCSRLQNGDSLAMGVGPKHGKPHKPCRTAVKPKKTPWRPAAMVKRLLCMLRKNINLYRVCSLPLPTLCLLNRLPGPVTQMAHGHQGGVSSIAPCCGATSDAHATMPRRLLLARLHARRTLAPAGRADRGAWSSPVLPPSWHAMARKRCQEAILVGLHPRPLSACVRRELCPAASQQQSERRAGGDAGIMFSCLARQLSAVLTNTDAHRWLEPGPSQVP